MTGLRLSRGRAFGAAVLIAAMGLAGVADADDDAPLTLQQRQQMRFPQPVRVGSLAGERVIQAGTSLKTLGVVVGVFQTDDGDMELVFRYGGVFGLGARIIAPPIEEVSLVGPMVKINDLDKMDLAALPTFTGSDGKFLGPDEIIKMGIDRKY
jgi:hypothetical protein